MAVVGVSLSALPSRSANGAQVRERLAGDRRGVDGIGWRAAGAGLRVHDARGAWIALVTAIEKAGVPLVDTKDATLRSRLVAAGYTQDMRRASIR